MKNPSKLLFCSNCFSVQTQWGCFYWSKERVVVKANVHAEMKSRNFRLVLLCVVLCIEDCKVSNGNLCSDIFLLVCSKIRRNLQVLLSEFLLGVRLLHQTIVKSFQELFFFLGNFLLRWYLFDCL